MCRGSQAGLQRGKNRQEEEKEGEPVDGETCIVLPREGDRLEGGGG